MHIKYSYQVSLKYDFLMMHLTTIFRMYLPYMIAIIYGVIINIFNYKEALKKVVLLEYLRDYGGSTQLIYFT